MKKQIFIFVFIFLMYLFHFSFLTFVFADAQQLFDDNKELLLRQDVRTVLPDALRIFSQEEIQKDLNPNIIEIILNGPRFLLGVDPNFTSQFVALLSIDDDLRALFRDEQFYSVLKSEFEINELIKLIEEAGPAQPTQQPNSDCEPSQLETSVPKMLRIVSGNNQRGESGTPLVQPFVVGVLDQNGKPLQNIPVTFQVTAGDGDISGQKSRTIHTDVYGQAQTTLTLGRLGVNSVEASVSVAGILQKTFTATATASVESPEPISPFDADVNGDDIVSPIDLSIVFTLITNPDSDIADVDADINKDGIVDHEDLVLVASALDSTAAAPSVRALVQHGISAADIQVLLTQARALPETTRSDPAYQRGIAVLELLLATLRQPRVVPKQTALLMNYPNPFNPETWIPYQLSEASDVTVTIYSVNGSRVRRLALGHRSAGLYQRKSRAAYWDGRNEFGEPVASGLYFYTLTAGDFTATRKMLIRK